jgi:hypothetical protein
MNARAALSKEVAPVAPGPVTDNVAAVPAPAEPIGPPAARESAAAAPRRRRG